MKYPTDEQTKGATARRTAPGFDLTERALLFARIYAENPRLGATECAIQAGYARRCKNGAHVRAFELLRDVRVLRAITYFSARALNTTMFEARQHLARLAATEGRWWNRWDHNAFNRLTSTLKRLETHIERVEKIYKKEVYTRIYKREFFQMW